jgi:GDPmannose 4,6-dehydratase
VGTFVDESLTPRPISKYGEDKFLAHSYLNEIRCENPNILATSLILFNHESPRRNQKFVTRKIVDRVFEISRGRESKLILGDIEIQRDWGYAKDFAEGIYRVLHAETNSDYVIGTGKLRSVRDFCIEIFENFGVDENRRNILCDETLKRSRNNNGLAGNSNLLESEIGWRPTVEFKELAKILTDAKIKGENAENQG